MSTKNAPTTPAKAYAGPSFNLSPPPSTLQMPNFKGKLLFTVSDQNKVTTSDSVASSEFSTATEKLPKDLQIFRPSHKEKKQFNHTNLFQPPPHTLLAKLQPPRATFAESNMTTLESGSSDKVPIHRDGMSEGLQDLCSDRKERKPFKSANLPQPPSEANLSNLHTANNQLPIFTSRQPRKTMDLVALQTAHTEKVKVPPALKMLFDADKKERQIQHSSVP
ncbi:hypothetical protein RUND412_000590 [Rhizina undulata]